MKHQTLEQLESIADITPLAPVPLTTRAQRMERWAEVLDQHPSRCLAALSGTEHLHPAVREEARAAGSPLTVAFEDPLLRASGLKSDTYGEAKRFFELSDWELHDIVCSCHVGTMMQANWVAGRVRRIVGGNRIVAWLRRLMVN
ncbi:hypothetical protein FJ934_02740 [Mesorhizobium sp. B2-4-12]|uniref:hypothetical protein n=1 Tax=unclassified Mesorhizobium TaxID=325217 RepID=UPI001128DF1E|nr:MULTISPECIES: hypothetical protein [unclassified Mesorhizobium]TPK76107.1 hypothetical protein FJ548_26585 [Mesorhizobium sp. B2-4-17]TPK98704.1 hypothetical protein FJ934_02740 [Mesorhizobium sp. B2-4-12]TPL12371.1 hypothetical protein FJ938_00390 [Mesorhizobium sp. B2-4-14]UCI29747.1 hypothetical protein FJW03_18105 [Mesorhizobium sp. B4-1-4]